MNGDRGKPSEVEVPPGRHALTKQHSSLPQVYAVTGKKARISYSRIFSSFLFFPFSIFFPTVN